ncbi:MAG TPA: hypothetical protein VKS43_11205 [Burkholderiales bacterium]|nr:hypothetical protein [Burkholderiales bacterium]
MKRLHLLLQALGPAGVAGIGVLLFCTAFYGSAIRPAERELGALRLAAARPAAGRVAAGDPRAAEFQRFYRLFPALERLPDALERLYALARGSGVELRRADYQLEDRGGPLAAYRVTLPLRAPYPRIREFIGAALQSMPILALDALRFERKKTDDPEVDAQLRLTMYFRRSTEE